MKNSLFITALTAILTFFPGINSLLAEDEPQYGFNLPDIGDPASEVLSVNQEAELGKILLPQVNRRLPISTDPEIRSYIQSLGTRLISGGLNSDFPYYFLVVFDNRINAFAMPGGIVAINSGLFVLTENESELASVVGHEISHVSQRHIARQFSRQQQLSVVSTLALLGSILATIYGGGSGAGQAATAATLGTLQQSQLAYTRSFEREADRLGMQLLVNANLDPHGMPRFFERLNAQSQVSAAQVPEFLRTHPLTLSRVSDSRARAAQFGDRNFIEDTIHYQYAKARIIAISSDANQLVNHYRKQIEKNPSNINHYIYGLALSRLGRGKKAINAINKIEPNNNEIFPVSIAKAQVLIANRDNESALDILENLDKSYPRNETVIFYLSTALIESKQPKKALDKLDTLNLTITGNPAIQRLRARAAEAAGYPWISHEALADYDMMTARYDTAMEQYLIALRQTGIDKNSKARIEVKKNELREFQRKQQ
ncbi:MAG: M48 family metalloprotease [Pseudomonadota bacterium]